jgi:hypothetical protein
MSSTGYSFGDLFLGYNINSTTGKYWSSTPA